MTETLLLAAAFAVVLFKTISVIASINIHNFDGHPLQFVGMAVQWSLLLGGAAATLIGLSIGAAMLVYGLAVMILSDRRRS